MRERGGIGSFRVCVNLVVLCTVVLSTVVSTGTVHIYINCNSVWQPRPMMLYRILYRCVPSNICVIIQRVPGTSIVVVCGIRK